MLSFNRSARLRLIYIILLSYFSVALIAHSFHQAYGQEEAQQKTSDKTVTDEGAEKENTEENADENNSEGKVLLIDRSKIDISAPVDHLTLKKGDLTHYLSEQEISPILAGSEDYLTLISTNTTANNKGVMILVPDWQQSASTPKALNYLHQVLPEKGWTSIKIQPPNKPENYPSTLLTQTEKDEENNKTLANYQQKLAMIMQAVTNKAKSYPGIIVVVVEGSNAAVLVNIYQQAGQENPMALIMLSGHLTDEKSNLQVAMNLAQIELPILDLYLTRDHPLVHSNALLRKKYVNQELKANYRQQQLRNINSSYYPQEILFKTITGWLKSIGW